MNRCLLRAVSLSLGILLGLTAHTNALAQTYETTRISSGSSAPLYVTAAPGDPDRLYVLEKSTGVIDIFNLRTGTFNPAPFITVPDLDSRSEGGLLGLAFHPDFQTNGQFYVNTTDVDDEDNFQTHIRRYTSTTSDSADPVTETTVLTFDQTGGNHNGGWIGFNPIANAANDNDHYLYIASGDGGGGNDPDNAGQSLDTLLGKMLRIDVDGDDFPADSERNYAIPASNPFVDGNAATLDEIWSYGLRNPWRSSFDRATGDLYIADVGQGEREEIDFQPATSIGGENYGWRLREGTIATPGVGGPAPAGAIEPIYDYEHGFDTFEGNSVSGGYVYRGPIDELQGQYVFADFISNQIWSFEFDGSAVGDFDGSNVTNLTNLTPLLSPNVGSLNSIASFGEDSEGNLFIVDIGGEIFALTCQSGDADCDGDVDIAGDILTAFSNFTGPGTFNRTREQGDVELANATAVKGDGDVDVSDILLMFGAFTGPLPDEGPLAPAAAGDPAIPDLIYNPATGEVILDVDGSSIIGYSLKSAGAFLAGGHTPILGGVSTSLPTELAEAALSSNDGSIGLVFPTGLDLAGLSALLTENTVSTGLGAPLVPFDLVVLGPAVPEPATLLLAALALLGLVTAGRRRRA